MSPTPPAPAADSKFGLGLLLGLAGACLAGLVITVPVGFVLTSKRLADDRGWNLVPVVVYAVDVAGGSTLTFDQISQRSVPEKFVDASVVKPDSASFVINQPVVSDAKAGDFVRWVDLATKEGAKCFGK